MVALAEIKENGIDVYLMVLDLKGNYCLFKLVSSNLDKWKEQEDDNLIRIRVRVGAAEPRELTCQVDQNPLWFIRNLLEIKSQDRKGKVWFIVQSVAQQKT